MYTGCAVYRVSEAAARAGGDACAGGLVTHGGAELAGRGPNIARAMVQPQHELMSCVFLVTTVSDDRALHVVDLDPQHTESSGLIVADRPS